MRVISGTARRRRLRTPKGNRTRPTSERVKEAIFDILGAEVRGARVLDLFAGSGGLGIEALSREARSALFVDSNRNAVDLIRRNLKGLGFADRSEVWRAVHTSALRRMGKMGYKFDLIFSDPPYQSGLTEEILRKLGGSGAVVEGGIVVTECWKKEKLSGKVGRFTTFQEKTYGGPSGSLSGKQRVGQGGPKGLFQNPWGVIPRSSPPGRTQGPPLQEQPPRICEKEH